MKVKSLRNVKLKKKKKEQNLLWTHQRSERLPEGLQEKWKRRIQKKHCREAKSILNNDVHYGKSGGDSNAQISS